MVRAWVGVVMLRVLTSSARQEPAASDLAEVRTTVRIVSAAIEPSEPEERAAPSGPQFAENGRGTWRSEDVYAADGRAYGFQCDDFVWGGTGADWLEGGSGDDFIDGGAGADTLIGGTGADFMRGRGGGDTFIFIAGDVGYQPPGASHWEPDVIHDFNPASGDVIRLYGFSALPVISETHSAPSLALVFPDGSAIVLDGVTAAMLAAYPNCIVLEPGPPPALEPEPPGPVIASTPVVIAEGEVHVFDSHVGYVLGGRETPPPSLTNHGTIEVTGPPTYLVSAIVASGYQVTPGARIINAETGVIRAVDVAGTFAMGFEIDGAFFGCIVVENRGLVEASSSHQAFGYRSTSQYAGMINHGTIRADGGDEATGVYHSNYDLYGVPLYTAPWYAETLFANTGTIEAVSDGIAVGFRNDLNGIGYNSGTIAAYGGQIAIGAWLRYTDVFQNDGDIVAESDGGISVGLYLQNISAAFGVTLMSSLYVNNGLIRGDIAILSDDGLTAAKSVEYVENNGVIQGAVILGFGDDRLTNAGKIYGDIDLGNGDDVYDGRQGLLVGMIDAGDGADALIGGDSGEMFFGGACDDAINGGAGDDFIDGGRGADALDGGAGYDVLSYLSATTGVTVDLAAGQATSAFVDQIRGFEAVIGGAFDDHLIGTSGGDRLEGNAGDDHLEGGQGDDILFGDAGNDVITTGSGHDLIYFTAGDGIDEITDFTPGTVRDQLRIFGYAGYQELRQVGTDTHVILSASDVIILRGVTSTALKSQDFQFDPTPFAPAPEPTWNDVNYIYWEDLTVVPEGDVVLVVNPIVRDSPFGAAVGIQYEGYEDRVGRALVNDGHIRIESELGTDALHGSIGSGFPSFWNRSGGLFETVSTGTSTAVGINNYYLIWNDGEFRVSAPESEALGILASTTYVHNTGLIAVDGDVAKGVRLTTGSRFWNDGDVDIQSRQAGVGVEFRATWTDNRFVNTGLIRVTDETAEEDSIGLSWWGLSDPGYFNSGVIEADYAIRHVSEASDEGRNDVGTIWNSGELRGRVDMGGGAGRIFNDGLITGRTDLGIGDDLYDGRLGRHTGGVYGGDGADILYGGDESETLNGGADDDIISGGGGADILTGGSGRDIFYFQVGSGADQITDFLPGAGAEAIRVVGYSAYQSITQVGADVSIVFSATDSLLLRNVQLSALIPADIVFSAAPLPSTPARPTPAEPLPHPEIADAPPPSEFIQTGAAGADHLSGGPGSNYSLGGAGDDVIEGGGLADRLFGEGGDDHILGGSGHDLLDGGHGDDILDGGTGDDLFYTGAGSDIVVARVGGGYDQVFDMGTEDWIRIEGVHDGGIVVEPFFGDLFIHVTDYPQEDGDPIVSSRVTVLGGLGTGAQNRIEVHGTSQDDNLRTSNTSQHSLSVARLFGHDGDDFLSVNQLAGPSYLDGGAGDDVLNAGGMTDSILIGGDGYDTILYDGVDIRQARVYHDGVSWIVSYSSSAYGWGKDRIYDIEQLRFADGVYDIGAIVCWTGSGPRPKLPQIGPGTSPDDPVDGKDGGPQVQPGLTDFPSDWTLGPPETPGLPGEPVELDNPAGRTDAEEPPVIPVVAPAPDLDFGADLRMWREHEQIRGFGDYACLV